MLEYGQKSSSSGFDSAVKVFQETGQRQYNSSYNGIDFRSYINVDDLGNVFIDNVHPR